MNTDNLDQLSDAALSEAFAVECAGWTRATPEWIAEHRFAPNIAWRTPGDVPYFSPSPFATDAYAVLPMLNANGRWKSDYSVTSEPPGAEFLVLIHHGAIRAYAPTFARAACIALIRAKRATERVHVDQGAHPEDAYANRAEKGQP